MFQLDKNGRPCLVWERKDSRLSPESATSEGSPGIANDGGPSRILHRPTPMLPRQGLWTPCFANGSITSGGLGSPVLPLTCGLIPPVSAALPPCNGINSLSNGITSLGNGSLISPQAGYQNGFQVLKRPSAHINPLSLCLFQHGGCLCMRWHLDWVDVVHWVCV